MFWRYVCGGIVERLEDIGGVYEVECPEDIVGVCEKVYLRKIWQEVVFTL